MEVLVIGSADMNSEFFSASYLINGKLLVDIPGGTCRELRKMEIRPESVEAVLITHMHGDHMLGLPIWALQKTKRMPPPEEGSIQICVNKEQEELLTSIVRNSFSTSFTEEKTGKYFRWISENEFTIADLRIRRVPVKHGTLPGCFGYLVTDGSVTVGFTGDSCICDGVREIVSSSDLVFCDCDLIVGSHKHMGINNLLSLVEKYPGTKIVATHLRDETRQELSRLKTEGITVAADGKIIQV